MCLTASRGILQANSSNFYCGTVRTLLVYAPELNLAKCVPGHLKYHA